MKSLIAFAYTAGAQVLTPASLSLPSGNCTVSQTLNLACKRLLMHRPHLWFAAQRNCQKWFELRSRIFKAKCLVPERTRRLERHLNCDSCRFCDARACVVHRWPDNWLWKWLVDRSTANEQHVQFSWLRVVQPRGLEPIRCNSVKRWLKS